MSSFGVVVLRCGFEGVGGQTASCSHREPRVYSPPRQEAPFGKFLTAKTSSSAFEFAFDLSPAVDFLLFLFPYDRTR